MVCPLLTPTSTDDREGLRDLVESQPDIVVLGDKGYVGDALTQEMDEQGICLMALKNVLTAKLTGPSRYAG